MSALQAIILGMVQGITEFLPISSSGHLVILQRLWHISNNNLLFIILVHLGTLVAVAIAMRKELMWLVRHPRSRVMTMLLLALLPTAVVGAVFEEWFEHLFETGATVGLEFVITGVILWWMDSAVGGRKTEETMSMSDSMWIGALQGAAILPALSRSGLTIAAGLWRGMEKEAAARFSFILSIPAILGATVMELDGLFEEPGAFAHVPWGSFLLGTLTALVAGYLGVKWTLGLLKKGRMRFFAIYTWALAAFILADQLFYHKFFPPLF